MRFNPVTLIDGYKYGHRKQYPPGTEYIYSNWTPRGSRIPGATHMRWVGLQYLCQEYLMNQMHENFFSRPLQEQLDKYQRRVDKYLGPNNVGVDHIRELHKLGYIPLDIRAFREGSAVPLRVPAMTVENTHPDFFWVVNYFETLFSSVLWMPNTSATTAETYRRILDKWADRTCVDRSLVDYQAHDFSFRGMPGPEAAVLSALGHSLYFYGSDTVPLFDLVEQYYPIKDEETLIVSVNATEHSVMCAGEKTGEKETIIRLLNEYPTGILSVVCDTWDLWNVITNILPSPEVRKLLMSRDGKFVVRPDSGVPEDIICGDERQNMYSPAGRGVVECLWYHFPGIINGAGYKEVDPHVGSIYGDSITPERAETIMRRLEAKGFASNNVVLGVGSYTYQHVTRDTYNQAFKATWSQQCGRGIDMFKDPVTDNSGKKSAIGRLAVLPDGNGSYYRVDRATPAQERASVLKPIWRDGDFVVRDSLTEIRDRARNG